MYFFQKMCTNIMIPEAKCVLTMSDLNRLLMDCIKNKICYFKTVYHNIFANRGQFLLMGFILKYTLSVNKFCLGQIVCYLETLQIDSGIVSLIAVGWFIQDYRVGSRQ